MQLSDIMRRVVAATSVAAGVAAGHAPGHALGHAPPNLLLSATPAVSPLLGGLRQRLLAYLFQKARDAPVCYKSS